MRIVSTLKNLMVPEGRKPRRILAGAFSGLVMDLDLETQTQLWAGTHEREVQGWLQRFSKGAHTAIDVGMAEGEYALFFLRKTAAQRVLGFEPLAASRSALTANLHLNQLANDARLQISAALVGRQPGPGMETLDDWLPQIGERAVVKVDVDGAEMDVLCGAPRLIARPAVRWIIETHTPALERDCMEHLTTAGYQVRIVRNAWWRLLLPELRVAAHFPENHNRWLVAARPTDLAI